MPAILLTGKAAQAAMKLFAKAERNTKTSKTRNKKKSKSTHKRLMTLPQKKALIKAIGKNKSMKPSSRKAAIRKIRAKKTRKS